MIKKTSLLLLVFLVSLATVSAQDTSPSLERGLKLYAEARWAEAVLELRRAAASSTLDSDRTEALYWIALSQIAASEYAGAVQDLDSLISLNPSSQKAREAVYHKGRALFYLGRYDEAILSLKAYSDRAPDDASRAAAAYWVGECLYSMGRLDDARRAFSTIVDTYPSSAKYEASFYRIALINQKKIESELLLLLKWSHEESLKTIEEYQRRERSYEQAIVAYQKRIAQMLKDTRLADLEKNNAELLARIAELENQKLAAQSPATSAETKLVEAAPSQGIASAPTRTALDEERSTRLLSIKSKALKLKDQFVDQLDTGSGETFK
ncbi:tetratricopeptide repeat protein [Treponema sp.]